MLVQPIESHEATLAEFVWRLVEALTVLDRNEHRKRSMVTLDEKALTGGGGIENGSQRAAQVERRDTLHSRL
jgi:hypothetical protein